MLSMKNVTANYVKILLGHKVSLPLTLQWRIQTYLTVVFSYSFCNICCSFEFLLSAETSETVKMVIFQKRAIIEGD